MTWSPASMRVAALMIGVLGLTGVAATSCGAPLAASADHNQHLDHGTVAAAAATRTRRHRRRGEPLRVLDHRQHRCALHQLAGRPGRVVHQLLRGHPSQPAQLPRPVLGQHAGRHRQRLPTGGIPLRGGQPRRPADRRGQELRGLRRGPAIGRFHGVHQRRFLRIRPAAQPVGRLLERSGVVQPAVQRVPEQLRHLCRPCRSWCRHWPTTCTTARSPRATPGSSRTSTAMPSGPGPTTACSSSPGTRTTTRAPTRSPPSCSVTGRARQLSAGDHPLRRASHRRRHVRTADRRQQRRRQRHPGCVEFVNDLGPISHAEITAASGPPAARRLRSGSIRLRPAPSRPGGRAGS